MVVALNGCVVKVMSTLEVLEAVYDVEENVLVAFDDDDDDDGVDVDFVLVNWENNKPNQQSTKMMASTWLARRERERKEKVKK